MAELFLLATEAASNPAHLKVEACVALIGLAAAFPTLGLGVFHREAHVATMKVAVTCSDIWPTYGIAFSALVSRA